MKGSIAATVGISIAIANAVMLLALVDPDVGSEVGAIERDLGDRALAPVRGWQAARTDIES